MRVKYHWQYLPVFLSGVINWICFFQSLKTVAFYIIQKTATTTKKEIRFRFHLTAIFPCKIASTYGNIEFYSRIYMYTVATTGKLERICCEQRRQM